jgi:hypothetical protein
LRWINGALPVGGLLSLDRRSCTTEPTRNILASVAWLGLLLFFAAIPRADAHTVYTWTGVCEATAPDPLGRVLYCVVGSLVTMRVVLTDDYVPGTTVTTTGGPPPIPFGPPPQILSWTIDILGQRYDVLLNRPPFLNLGFITLSVPVLSGSGNAVLQGTTSGTIDATGWSLNVLFSLGTQLCCHQGHGSVGQWQRLIPVATVVSVVASPNPAVVGQSVTLTATVSGANPTGSVQFQDGTASIGPAVALGNGSATLTIAGLRQGFHAIAASYSGDDANAASNSPALALEISAMPALPSTPVPSLSFPALIALAAMLAALGLRLRRSTE